MLKRFHRVTHRRLVYGMPMHQVSLELLHAVFLLPKSLKCAHRFELHELGGSLVPGCARMSVLGIAIS